jgi:PPIC-type PPIASE domain
VRRVLVLVVVAATIAVGAGLAIPSSAITVNADRLSQAQLNQELAAIAASAPYQCFVEAQAYLNGLSPPTPVHGVSPPSWYSTPTVEWANSRATDLAIIQYVEQHYPPAFAPASLAAARVELAAAMNSTILAAYAQGGGRSQGFSCAGLSAPPAGEQVGAIALNSMPAWFQDEQVQANAAELGLQHLIPSALPTAGPALGAWYREHAGEFATTCFAFIESPSLDQAQLVAAKIAHGLSFADAAARYSVDRTTKDKGGALGCYAPTSPEWATVQHYVGAVPTGHVSAPLPFPNTTSYLLFTVTKRTPNTFQSVSSAVSSANEAVNRTRAEVLAVEIQRAADITVSPAIGTWQPSAAGGTILPPAAPPPSSVTNPSANAPVA